MLHIAPATPQDPADRWQSVGPIRTAAGHMYADYRYDNMPNYKITYFNGRGRAETCRLLMAVGAKKWDDNRIDSEQWPELKPSECELKYRM